MRDSVFPTRRLRYEKSLRRIVKGPVRVGVGRVVGDGDLVWSRTPRGNRLRPTPGPDRSVTRLVTPRFSTGPVSGRDLLECRLTPSLCRSKNWIILCVHLFTILSFRVPCYSCGCPFPLDDTHGPLQRTHSSLTASPTFYTDVSP